MASTSNGQKLALRIKSKKSQQAVLRDVDTKDTIQILLDKLTGLTGVPKDQIAILKGFPPKRVAYKAEDLIETLGLQHQDTLIVETDASGNPNRGEEPVSGRKASRDDGANRTDAVSTSANEQPSAASPGSSGANSTTSPIAVNNGSSANTDSDIGVLLRHVVPSDNSCLFTSVTFCLSGMSRKSEAQNGGDSGSSFLRDMIANTVGSDPVKFSEAMLGRRNSEYVDWIRKPESWGGGIELSILADFYGVQISVVDTQSLHISCFGEDHNYPHRMFLIYDGIHYDPLYLEEFKGGKRTIFDTSETVVMDLAQQLAREAKASNQYTDLTNFSLRCQTCNTLLKGQKEAQAHAKTTNHTNFAEITRK